MREVLCMEGCFLVCLNSGGGYVLVYAVSYGNMTEGIFQLHKRWMKEVIFMTQHLPILYGEARQMRSGHLWTTTSQQCRIKVP